MEEKNICKHCGGDTFIELLQDGRGFGEVNKIGSWISQIIYHITCESCGTVVKSFVKDLDELTGNKYY